MRQTALLFSLLPIPSILASNAGYSPFTSPLFGLSDEALLVKRQNCQSGYNQCANLGANEACCPPDTNCELDQAGHVACCPISAACTGTVNVTITGSQTGPSTGGSSNTDFILGGTTSSTTTFQAPGSLTTGVEGGGSTVPNTQYPFIYIPTSYANADLCLTAYSQCQAQSTACLTSLAGVNGVTVSGLGFGITVEGASVTVLSSASSVCSSLSQEACYGIQENVCNNFGGGVATATDATASVVQQNAVPRRTACPGMVYAAGAGAVAGAMGALA
jgi:hypothetical protein